MALSLRAFDAFEFDNEKILKFLEQQLRRIGYGKGIIIFAAQFGWLRSLTG